MTQAEWMSSTNVPAMLETLWEAARNDDAVLVPALHRYFLKCCRRIWRLLPQPESRLGVEIGEQFLAGLVSDKELYKINWYVEGAAFTIDYNTEPEAIDSWMAEVNAISASEMAVMLNPPGLNLEIEARELLKRAAYFADYAMLYPHLTPKHRVPGSYVIFLSPELLRQQFWESALLGWPGA
jgi:hypothetical protein